MGSAECEIVQCRLWNISRDNLSCLKGQNRRKTPNLADFLEPVITEMDPEEAVEEMYKVPLQSPENCTVTPFL